MDEGHCADLDRVSTQALVTESEKTGISRRVSYAQLFSLGRKIKRKIRPRKASKVSVGISRNQSLDCIYKQPEFYAETHKIGLIPVYSSSTSLTKPAFLSQACSKKSELVSFAVKEKRKHPEAHCIYVPRGVRMSTTNLKQQWTLAQSEIRQARVPCPSEMMLPPLRVAAYKLQK